VAEQDPDGEQSSESILAGLGSLPRESILSGKPKAQSCCWERFS
jgi:hypothetical protein